MDHGTATTEQPVETDEEMLQAAYVLISLAHGDKDEFNRTHRVNLKGQLNGNTNDGATALSRTRDRGNMEV